MSDRARIRAATAADGPALAALMVQARRAAVPAIPPMVHDADDVLAWMTTVVLPQQEVWVIQEPSGPLLGVLALDGSWLAQLYLEPTRTGEGLGTRLLDHAKARRPDGLRLWAFQSNVGAQRFYVRHDFHEIDRTDGSGNEERSPDVLYAWDGARSGAPGGAAPQDTQIHRDHP